MDDRGRWHDTGSYPFTQIESTLVERYSGIRHEGE